MISEKMTMLARPYAIAAFETALDRGALDAWQTMLDSAAMMVNDHQVAQLLDSPSITMTQLTNLFCDVLAPMLDAERKNFVCLLAEHNRFALFPSMAALFKQYRAEHEKTMTVDILSAVPLNSEYQQKFAETLAQRLHRKIILQCSVDPALIGGAIVRAGDTVIDGSVRGKLNRLLESL